MKLDLDKFYNSNWKTFVHKEAIEEALKLVPEVELKDVEVENIISITFSVDEYGENPIYIEYLDKEGKKHLVRIRPAVSNEIQEILKKYVTKEEHQADVETIYNYFTTLNVPMEVRSQNGLDDEGRRNIILNNNNAFVSFQIDPENDDAIQWLAIQNKNGDLGDQYQYFARFVDFAKVNEVPSNADFAEKVQELEEKMNTADKNVLETSKEYTDSSITSLGDELNVKIEQTKNDLTVLIGEKAQDTLQQSKDYADTKDSEYFETSKRYTDNTKQETIDESKAYTDSETNKTLIASKNYTDTKHDETMQQITELDEKLTPDVESLKETQLELNISVDDLSERLSHDIIQVFNNDDGSIQKIYFYKKDETAFGYINFDNYRQSIIDEILEDVPDLPTNVVTTETLDNILLQYVKKADLNNYYTKTESDNKYALRGELGGSPVLIDNNPVDNINFRTTNGDVTVTENDEIKMIGKFISTAEKSSIAEYKEKSSELATRKIPNRYWYADNKTPNYEHLIEDGNYVRNHINNPVTGNETIVYTPKFKVEDKIDEKNKLYTATGNSRVKLAGDLTVHYDGDKITKLSMHPTSQNDEKQVVFGDTGTIVDFPVGEVTFDKIHYQTDGSLLAEYGGEQGEIGRLMFTDKTQIKSNQKHLDNGEIYTMAHVLGHTGSIIANRMAFNSTDGVINCNVAPVETKTLAVPKITECNAFCQLKTTYITNCISSPTITQWNMRTIEMTDDILRWQIRQPYGKFMIQGKTYFNTFGDTLTEYEQSYYNGIILTFDTAQNWGARSGNSYTGYITFQVGSGTTGFNYRKLPCVILEDGLSMRINVLDTSALRGLASDSKGFSGTTGYIEVTVNGNY